VYPLRLSEASKDDVLLPALDEWRENLDPELASRLAIDYGRRPTVEEIGWYVFAILSAPSFRTRFSASLAIDHPRIPFPAGERVFRALTKLGSELGRAHLLEAPISADIRFEGGGTNAIDAVRYDADTHRVWVNATQAFTGISNDGWVWGEHFRPIQHYLDDRRGRRLDTEQIQGFQSAIHAVQECIRLAPALDNALAEVLSRPLSFTDPFAKE
jgi:hypothetical protein